MQKPDPSKSVQRARLPNGRRVIVIDDPAIYRALMSGNRRERRAAARKARRMAGPG